MLTFGVLSLLQVWVLPGFALLCWLPYRPRLPDGIVFTLTASLAANYILVWGLVLSGLYTRNALLSVVALEVLAVFAGLVMRRPADTALRDRPDEASATQSLGRLLVLGAFALSLLVYLIFVLREVGEVHTRWDAITSWNRWAVAWASGHFPKNTWGYPQLLPMMWSITHVMIASSSIQLFAHLVNLIFPLAALAATAAAYLRRPTIDHGIALIALALVLLAAAPVRDWAFSGYADVPVACLCLIAVLILLELEEAPEGLLRPSILCGAVVVGLAAATKQAGLLLVFAYPLLVLTIAPLPRGRSWRLAVLSLGLGLIFALPSYIFWKYRLMMGQDTVLVQSLVTADHLHGNRDIFERIPYSLSLLLDKLGLPVFLLLIATYLFALRDRRLRWVMLFFVLPYTILWAIGFSYSLRNLLPVIPLSAVLCGLAPTPIWVRLQPLFDRPAPRALPHTPKPQLRDCRKWFALAICLLLGLVALLPIRDADLEARQVDRIWSLGDAKVNRAVADFVASQPGKPMIVTNYAILKRLPIATDIDYRRADFRNWPALSKLLAKHPHASVLLWTNASTETAGGLNRLVAEKRYEIVFENDDARLFVPRAVAP